MELGHVAALNNRRPSGFQWGLVRRGDEWLVRRGNGSFARYDTGSDVAVRSPINIPGAFRHYRRVG
jgi:hypothetical protein